MTENKVFMYGRLPINQVDQDGDLIVKDAIKIGKKIPVTLGFGNTEIIGKVISMTTYEKFIEFGMEINANISIGGKVTKSEQKGDIHIINEIELYQVALTPKEEKEDD